MFLNLMNTILNFAIALGKGSNEKFAITSNVDIVKNVICPDFQTEVGAQSNQQNIRIAEAMLKCERLSALVEALNGDDAWSNPLGILYLDEVFSTQSGRSSMAAQLSASFLYSVHSLLFIPFIFYVSVFLQAK